MAGNARLRSDRHNGKYVLWLLIIFALFALDQGTKYYFAHTFEPGQVSPVFPGFNLVLAFNRGAAFSFLAHAGGWQMWLFSALAIVVIVVMLRILRRQSEHVMLSLALASICAGAAGNLVDRLFRGYVIDFLDFYVNGMHWPAFNVADIAICVGAGLLIIDEFFGLRTRTKR